MAPSLSRSGWGSGSRQWRRRRLTLSPAPRGRTFTARASTPGSATSCSTGKSSTHCASLRSSSIDGAVTTIQFDLTAWATGHRRRRASRPSTGSLQCTNIQTGSLVWGRSESVLYPSSATAKLLGPLVKRCVHQNFEILNVQKVPEAKVSQTPTCFAV